MYSLKIAVVIFDIFGTVDFTKKHFCQVKEVVKISNLNILFFKYFQNKSSTVRKQRKRIYTQKK